MCLIRPSVPSPHARRARPSACLILALQLAIILLALVGAPLSARADEPTGINGERRHITCTALSEAAQAYYTGAYAYDTLATLPGASDTSDSYSTTQNNQLFDALHDLMRSTLVATPTYAGFAKGSLAYYWNSTDTSPDVNNVGTSSHFLLFYSDIPYVYPNSNVKMNREHIWPKSHASFSETNGGSDLHHLRPSFEVANTTKSDYPFGYVDEVYTTGIQTGTYGDTELYKVQPEAGVFEPKDDVKGDVARILLYVYCCWLQPNLYSDIPAEHLPPLEPDDQTNYGTRVITDLDTLLTWCEDDPVDTWEMTRNDLTQQVQGNRNVFIDYPELAWKIFGRDVPAGIQTPTHEGCTHVRGEPEYVEASCTEPGTKRETCTVCGNVHTEPTPAPGHIDEDDDRHCDRCGKTMAGTFHRIDGLDELAELDSLDELDHVLVYHPTSEKAMAVATNTNNRLQGISTENVDDTITPPAGVAIMQLTRVDDTGWHLARDGQYLTTPSNGGRLYWTDKPDKYAVWTIEDAGDGTFSIVNTAAVSYSKPQALEFFNNAFTTYGLATGDGFQFMLFSTPDHTWEELSRTEPQCIEPGSVTRRCEICGKTDEKELAATGHDWGAWTTTKAATQTEEGESKRICNNDPTHFEVRTIPATGTDETDKDKEKSTADGGGSSSGGTAAKPSAHPTSVSQSASTTTLSQTGDLTATRWTLALAIAGALSLALGTALRAAERR